MMTPILRTIAVAATLAVGIGATAVYAQQVTPQSASPSSDTQPQGMMGHHGSMMNSGMGDMMGIMSQASRMMGHCNEMMQSHMQAPNSQWQKPGPHSNG